MKIYLAIVHAVLSCIRGYHVLYRVIRTAVMVEQLLRVRKPGFQLGLNAIERYALAVKKDSCITVGHLP